MKKLVLVRQKKTETNQ